MFDQYPSLDKVLIQELKELDPEDNTFLEKVLDMFVDDVKTSFSKLNTLVPEEDAQEIHKLTHPLKSSSGNVGALKLAAIFTEMDNKSKANDLQEMESLFLEAQKEFCIVEKKIKEILE
ncbi:MAG: Hpt domain-containing protein [Nitrospinae bacterium]|nr:Hpt domain-containing protein [Nitrospinota bacterium]